MCCAIVHDMARSSSQSGSREFSLDRPNRRRTLRHLLDGAGTLSPVGTGRAGRLIEVVLRDDGWGRDALAIEGDFQRSLSALEKDLPESGGSELER